jgi:hypothetical protein
MLTDYAWSASNNASASLPFQESDDLVKDVVERHGSPSVNSSSTTAASVTPYSCAICSVRSTHLGT